MRTLVPAPTRGEVPDSELESYDRVLSLLQQPYFAEKQRYPAVDLFGALLHCPPLARHLIEIGHCFRSFGEPGSEQAIPDAALELADLAAFAHLRADAVRTGATYDFTRNVYNHLPRALVSGVRAEAARAALAGTTDGMTRSEAEVVEQTRAVLDGTLTDDQFAALEEQYGRAGAVVFTTFVHFVAFIARLQGSLGCSNSSDEEVASLLATLEAGADETPG